MQRKWLFLMCLGSALAAAPAIASPVRGVIVLPTTAATPIDKTPNTIYLNRCAGGCSIRHGTSDDARTLTSTIPSGGGSGPGGTFPMTDFAWGDLEWNAIVQCVREVYSPFNVTVTDVKPADTVDYAENIVAGTPQQLNLSPDFGGIAVVRGDCNPVDHAISYSFANIYTDPNGRVNELCWTVAQETAHSYGLHHSYEYFDHTSACNDPMTYRRDCGGQKFFRNLTATCGEFSPNANCECSNTQNTHARLLSFLGAGTPLTKAASMLKTPANGATITNGAVITTTASAQRGIATVEFRLNGYPWKKVPGVPVGLDGQPPADYSFTLPNNVPDGVIDIEAVALDDLGISATSKVTVTKGAPCATADTCLTGQKCEAGKCFWDPPAGETGDVCDYPQFCKNETCVMHDGGQFCTQDCHPNAPGTCPDGTECVGTGATGQCFPAASGGGCCSSSRDDTPYAMLALSGLVGGLVIGRRRRRR